MATTIVATPGASTANSYVTKSEADVYFAQHWQSAWKTYTDPDGEFKNSALVVATQFMDMLPWKGRKMNDYAEGHPSYQPLEWPRSGGGNAFELVGGSATLDGEIPRCYDYAGNVIIPKIIKQVCFEEAEFILLNDFFGDDARAQLIRGGVRSMNVPGVFEVYRDPAGFYAHYFSPTALRLAQPFILTRSNRIGRG